MKVKHNGKVTEKTLDNIRASLIKRNKIEINKYGRIRSIWKP